MIEQLIAYVGMLTLLSLIMMMELRYDIPTDRKSVQLIVLVTALLIIGMPVVEILEGG